MNDGIDPDLVSRVAAGHTFAQCWELLEAEARQLSTVGRNHFYDLIRRKLLEMFPNADDPRDKPMATGEAARFSESTINFGKYDGFKVEEIPISYLIWLSEQTTTDDVRRYLKHPRIAKMVREYNDQTLGGDDDERTTAD